MISWLVPPEHLVSPAVYLAGITAVATLVGLSKAGFGGGVGVLATPLVLFLLPGPTALSVMLPILISCDIMTLARFSRTWDRAAFWAVAPWMFLGLFAGLWLLVMFARMGVHGDVWIKLLVGIVVVTFTTFSILAPKPAGATSRRPRQAVVVPLGLACGITTMVAHAAGVLLNLFLLSRRPSPATFVGTTARLYLTFNLIKIPFFIAATPLAGRDFLTWTTFRFSLWVLPACYVGVVVGARLNRILPKERYLTLVNTLLLVTGIYLILATGRTLLL